MAKDFVKTSDYPYAAYLMLHGYTALNCVDEDIFDDRGNPRFNFYLTHAEDDIRGNIIEHANDLREKYEAQTDGYRLYYLHLRKLRKLSRNPIKLADYGGK